MSGGLLKLNQDETNSPVNEPKRQITNRSQALNGNINGRGGGVGGGDFQPYAKIGGKRQGTDLAVPAIKISDTDNPKNQKGERRILTRDMNLL